MIASAFVGWQMGAGQKRESLEDYCRRCGLVERERKLTPEEKKAIAQFAKDKAERIVKLHQAQKAKNGKRTV